MTTQLVWYKRDLRVSDHAPLVHDSEAECCVCLYVYEPEIIEAEDFDAARLNFINESLVELRESLRQRGGELLLRTGRMPDVLEQLHQEIGFDFIWAHEETFNQISYQRDRRVRAWAKSKQVPLKEIPQYGVVRQLKNRDGWATMRSADAAATTRRAKKTTTQRQNQITSTGRNSDGESVSSSCF